MLYIIDIINENVKTKVNGYWVPAKLESYHSWWHRLKDAWEVFRYRAEAVKWPDERNFKR